MRLSLLLLWTLLAAVTLWPLLRRGRLSGAGRRGPVDELVKDPVCQTYIVRSRAVARVEDGRQRYFCSDRCARQFASGRSGSRG
jgi:YHS domain-containing protein